MTVAVRAVPRFVPVIVTVVLPAVGPAVGLMLVTVGPAFVSVTLVAEYPIWNNLPLGA